MEMSDKSVIKAAIERLGVERGNLYKSANEVFITSLIHALMTFAFFIFCSFLFPAKLSIQKELINLLGFGGGGTTGGITLARGIRERLERRDKARETDALIRALQTFMQAQELSQELQKEIVNTTLELALRTISGHDLSRRKIKRDNGKC